MKFKTQRLLVREFEASDMPAVLATSRKPGFFYMSLDGTENRARAFIERAIRTCQADVRDSFLMAVALKSAPETAIGFTCVDNLAPQNGNIWPPDTGTFIDPDHQNQGYAKEAKVPLMRHCFKERDVLNMMGTADPKNTASIRVLRAMGYELTVFGKVNQTVKGPEPRLIFTIDRDDFLHRYG